MLLVDEVDRADEEFEAFMLESLLGLAGDDSRDRHHQGRRTRRTSSSPRTGRASCPTRSAAAASTSGSTTRASTRKCAIVERKVPGIERAAGPRDLALHGDRCDACGCPRCPGWPRRSTGRRRWRRCTPTISTRSSCWRRSAASSRTPTTSSASARRWRSRGLAPLRGRRGLRRWAPAPRGPHDRRRSRFGAHPARRRGCRVTLVQVTRRRARARASRPHGPRARSTSACARSSSPGREEIPAFDRCFDAFWRVPGRRGAGARRAHRARAAAAEAGRASPAPGAAAARSRSTLALEGWEERGQTTTASRSSVPGVSEQEVLWSRTSRPSRAEQLDEVRAAHRADRQAAGAADQPAPAAGRARRGRSTCGARCAPTSCAARSSSCASGERKRRKIRLVLLVRRLRLDGSLQPLPAAVPVRAPERLRARGDVHVLHATHARHRASARARSYRAGPAPADRGARLVGRHPHRRVAARSSTASWGAPGRPPHHRHRALRRLGHRRSRRCSPPSCCASSAGRAG